MKEMTSHDEKNECNDELVQRNAFVCEMSDANERTSLVDQDIKQV